VEDINVNMSPFSGDLSSYIEAGKRAFDAIPDIRVEKLDEIAGFVRERVERGGIAKLTFICTHNSRRSHMAQIWAQTAAAWHGVPGVSTFSGGTEVSAFNPRAVAALRRAGLILEKADEGQNPVYRVGYAAGKPAMEAFSKVYSEPPNPQEDFCAVMTCSDADANCPIVSGAAKRVAIPYEDPKAFDGTDKESLMYDERCRQISNEMMYLFSRVNRK
jgi:protein-tyrosine phosphatase/arsenate reductase